MKIEKIRYLIKFVSKIEYAEDLIHGKLFMRPAAYYHSLELGQGDMREAAISDEIAVYKNARMPIYCMYAVLNDEIVNDEVHISKRCINDFGCDDGYAVILDYYKLEPLLSNVKTDGYSLKAGLVNYHIITPEDFETLFADQTLLNLFVKHPFFAYQREYRIVIAKPVFTPNEPPVDHVEYWFEDGLQSLSRIVDISTVPRDNDSYVLKI